MLGAYIFIIVVSSWIDPLVIMQCPSLSLVTFFILKSILSDMSIAIPAFFRFPFAWNIFFLPLAFSLYVSLGLKWFSFRQHIYGYCFCIYSASLCLLVGAFNPFMFKVIIDMYVPMTIFLIVLGLFLQVIFFSCVSHLENFLQHLLQSWFVGAELSQLLLVCKAFDLSIESE